MFTAAKVRLCPNKVQKILLEEHSGSCRFVYSYLFAKRDEYYIAHKDAVKSSLNCLDTQSILIDLKKEHPWSCQVNSQSLQMSLRFLDNAFKNFFHKDVYHPKFRRKEKDDYFAVPQNMKIRGNRICFPKFHEGVYLKGSEKKPSEIKIASQLIITKDASDYYCNIVYETEEDHPERIPVSAEKSVGIDLGIEKFTALSGGTIIEKPRYIEKVEKRIKRIQEQLSRKQKGSDDRRKLVLKLQRNYRKLRNIREGFFDKVSGAIAKRYDTVILEDFNLQGMMQNHHASKSVTDDSFYALRRKVEWKARKCRKNLILIGTFDPSSRLCSDCGNIKHDLKLSDRVYRYGMCDPVADRDFNTSKNLRKIGLIKVGPVQPESGETATSGLYGIYSYRQTSVAEAGNPARQGGIVHPSTGGMH
jgi:putative transposase